MDQNKRVALLTAIDLGNLTRAAEQLGYTQSGLSYVIKAWRPSWAFLSWCAPAPGSAPRTSASAFCRSCGSWTGRAAS